MTGYTMDYSSKIVCTDSHNPHEGVNIESGWATSAFSLPSVAGQRTRINRSASLLCQLCHTTNGLVAYANALIAHDTAQVVSISASHALSEVVTLTTAGDGSLCKGNFSGSGSVPGSAGIHVLSDLKNIEDSIAARAEWRRNRRVGVDFRSRCRQYDEKINNTRDSRVNTALATLDVKWQQEES